MATTRHGSERRRRSWAGSLRRARASPAAHTPILEPPLPRFSDTIAVASSSFSSCAAGGSHAQPTQRQMCWVYSQSAPRSMKKGIHALDSPMRGNDRLQGGDDGSEYEDTTRALAVPVRTSIILLSSAAGTQRTILRAVRPSAQAMAYSRQGTAGNGRASHCGKEKQ
jgi:hypothetical protein